VVKVNKHLKNIIIGILSITGISALFYWLKPTEEQIKHRQDEKEKNNKHIPKGERCASCMYWMDIGDDRPKMVCKKKPPVQNTYAIDKEYLRHYPIYKDAVEWPKTEANDWCGEFDQK
jgi:hypothetical protein